MYICEVNYILTFKSRSYEKQITFLVLVILCLTSVEIYSSRQELKFDAPLPSNTENGNARSDYGPPGEGDKCWYFDGASSCVNFHSIIVMKTQTKVAEEMKELPINLTD